MGSEEDTPTTHKTKELLVPKLTQAAAEDNKKDKQRLYREME